MSAYYGWARCPGTCGEWLQGAKNGTPFLIGCPIDQYVEVETRCSDEKGQRLEKNNVWSLPQQKVKTVKALTLLADQYGLNLKGKVDFLSELPVGKGMASSTADLSATIAAVLSSLEISWEPVDIARIALAIEPSDPVMFPGITEFAHQDGKYMRELGPNVSAKLLVLDWGGTLDTQGFNARSDLNAHYRKHETVIRKALSLFYEGMAHSDLEKLACAATLSTQCNQEINPKPFVQEILSMIRRMGGLGMITAHSGTLIAGVFPTEISQVKKEEILQNLRSQYDPAHLEWMETQNGGLKILPTEKREIRSTR